MRLSCVLTVALIVCGGCAPITTVYTVVRYRDVSQVRIRPRVPASSGSPSVDAPVPDEARAPTVLVGADRVAGADGLSAAYAAWAIRLGPDSAPALHWTTGAALTSGDDSPVLGANGDAIPSGADPALYPPDGVTVVGQVQADSLRDHVAQLIGPDANHPRSPTLDLDSCAGLETTMSMAPHGMSRTTGFHPVVRAVCVGTLPLRFTLESDWSNVIDVRRLVVPDRQSAILATSLGLPLGLGLIAADIALVYLGATTSDRDQATFDYYIAGFTILWGILGAGLGLGYIPTLFAHDDAATLYASPH